MVQLGGGACSLRRGCLRAGPYLELLNEDFSARENKVTNFKAGSAGCATTVRNKNKPKARRAANQKKHKTNEKKQKARRAENIKKR